MPTPFKTLLASIHRDAVRCALADFDADRDGNITGQWIKTDRNQEAMTAAIAAWIDKLSEDVKPLPPIKPPKKYEEDLLAVIPMGDPHFGMYAWAQEAGDDFDLNTADRLTRGAIDRLVRLSPAAKECLLINLGDFFHADDQRNATPASGQIGRAHV